LAVNPAPDYGSWSAPSAARRSRMRNCYKPRGSIAPRWWYSKQRI